MLSIRCLSICSAILIAIFPFGTLAAGSPKAEAKEHFKMATRLYEIENYEGAVTEFETSIKLYPTKNGYFNLANCYNALHRYDEALTALQTLDQRFGDKLDATMRRKAESLQSLILSLVGELTIVITPLEAEVLLNGKRLKSDQVGRPIRLGPGEYSVEARLDGYSPKGKTITVHSQQKKTVDLTVSPLGGRLVIEANIAGAVAIVDGEPQGEVPVSVSVSAGDHQVEISVNGQIADVRTVEAESDAETRVSFNLADSDKGPPPPPKKNHAPLFRTLKIAGIVSTASTMVASGVFYGFAAKYASDFNKYNDAYTSEPSDSVADTLYTKAQDAKKKTETFSNMGLAFGISAGVLAASTAVVFVLSRKLEDKNESARVSVGGGTLKVSF